MRKKLYVLFLICIMLFAFVCGCAQKAEEPTEYIGIVSAMDNEIDLLLKEAEIDHVDVIAGVKYHIGSLHGQPVIITRSGIGKIRAASGPLSERPFYCLPNYNYLFVSFLIRFSMNNPLAHSKKNVWWA